MGVWVRIPPSAFFYFLSPQGVFKELCREKPKGRVEKTQKRAKLKLCPYTGVDPDSGRVRFSSEFNQWGYKDLEVSEFGSCGQEITKVQRSGILGASFCTPKSLFQLYLKV
jgi:hypothetical protein